MSEGVTPEIVVRVFIPDLKANRCIAVQPSNKVLVAQNNILDRISASIQDAQNYAFYLPPTSSSIKGTFLDEQLTFEDYTLLGHVPILEFRHISRDYGGTEGLTDRQVMKMSSKSNRKKFLDLVRAGQAKKVEKFLEQGLDPNFITEDGNTPLGIACGRGGKPELILILVKGGAHLYFRGKDGLTPVHRASIGGNTEAIKTLLALGASPNYRDAKGLTPLYHTAVMGDDLSPCLTLLMHYSEINVRDANLYTELHQAAKFGNIGHIDLLIHYGADMSAANSLGNSPLHLAASQGRVKAVQLLLVRGADKAALNHQGNPPNQVAIICGHHNIASVIVNFSPGSADPFTAPPEYNVHSRYVPKGGKTSVTDLPFTTNGTPKSPPTPTMAAAMMQQAVDDGHTPLPGSGERGRTFSLPDVRPSPSVHGRRNTVDPSADIGPAPSPLKTLTRTPSGSGGVVKRFIVTEDYTPVRAGELLVKKGMTVEVLQTRHDGLCLVQSGSRKGWLHLKILREIPSGSGRPSPGIGRGMPTAASTPPPTATPTGPPMTQVTMPGGGIIRRPSFTAVGVAQGVARSVTVIHNNRGYGFAMRGVTATALARKTFRPTPQVPGLQYVAKVDAESSADEAGLKEGDFLLEINGQDVTVADHKEVVKVIRTAGGKPLVMKVMFPSPPTTNGNGDQARDSLQSIPERGRHASESSASNHSPALGNVGRDPSSNEHGEKSRSRYDRSYLRERRLRQGSESSAPSSLQTTPTRQRVMSDSVAIGRESPPTTVRAKQAPVPPPRGDSPHLTYRSGSVSSLQSSQSSSSQQGYPPESSSTATPQPTESEEDVEDDPSVLAKELQTAIKNREVRQRSQSVGVLNSEAEASTHSGAGKERKMSAFESELHQKAEERQSRVIEDKLRLTASKHSTLEKAADQSSTSVQSSMGLGVPITAQHGVLSNPSRDSVDILTKLMAVVGQVPDKEQDSLEGGFRQSWASDDSGSRPVSAVASPYVSHTQLLPVKESQLAEEEERDQSAMEDGTEGDLTTPHAVISQDGIQPASPVEPPPTLYTAPPTTAVAPPTAARPQPTTSAPSSITTASSLNTSTHANNLTTPPSSTATPLPETTAPPPTTAAPPPTLPKPKWLKDGRPLKSASNLHANPADDDTRVRAASTSTLLPARPKEPTVPTSPPLDSGSQADIVPDQHGWFDVKSFLKSSTVKQPASESVSLPTETVVQQVDEVLPVSQNRRMHIAPAQPSLVVAAAFDEEDVNVPDKGEDRDVVSLDMAEKHHGTISFDDASNSGFDWNMWENSVTVTKDSQAMRGSADDAEGGGWPSFYDDDPVMEAWGEGEVVHTEEDRGERREEATPSEENRQGGSDSETSLEMPPPVHDLPPPIVNDSPPEDDVLDELEPVPPELLPPPFLDDDSAEEEERIPDCIFLPPPPLDLAGATLEETSTDHPLSILLPPPDIPTLTVEDFDTPGESSFPVIGGDLPSPNSPLDVDDTMSSSITYPPLPPPHLHEGIKDGAPDSESEEDNRIPSLPPPFADNIPGAKESGRLSILIDAPFDFQPFSLEVDPASSAQQSDNESDASDLPPPPPSSAPPSDSPCDTPLEFMLPPPVESADNSFIAPVDIDVMAPPPPRFEVEAAVDDEVFASSGSLVDVKDQGKLSSTPPSLRAAFSRYSIALEAEKLGFPSQEPPVYSFKHKAVELWDVEDVCDWLKEIGLEKHLETFRENEIAGEHLVDMTKEDLKELGVKQFGHRVAITSKLQRLLRIQKERP